MKDLLSGVQSYLLLALNLSIRQLILVFAIPLVLALFLQIVNMGLQRQTIKLIGRKAYIFLIAWIGVPIHELGHLIFCLIFGHRVSRVVLFDFDNQDGTLGYVTHSYNKKNIYQSIGNFFIGIAPIFFACFVIYLLGYFLIGLRLPLWKQDIAPQTLREMGIGLIPLFQDSAALLAKQIFNGSWYSLLFLYLSFAIGININLSTADLKHLLPGFTALVLLLFIFNLATAWRGDFSIMWIYRYQGLLQLFHLILITVLVLSLALVFLVWLVNALF